MDAVKMSLDRKGYLDLKLVSLLLDKTEDETIAALKEVETANGKQAFIFYDPQAQKWVMRDEYLSGDTRAKLQLVRTIKDIDSDGYNRFWLFDNEAELTKRDEKGRYLHLSPYLLPPASPFIRAEIAHRLKSISDIDSYLDASVYIDGGLGSGWIEVEHIQEFAAHILSIPEKDVRCQHVPELGLWSVTGSSKAIVAAAKSEYASGGNSGRGARDVLWLLEQALNQRPIKVQVLDEKKEVDKAASEKATDAAIAQVERLKKKFKEWLWSDLERAYSLTAKYNRLYPLPQKRVFDGSYLTLPDSNSKIQLRSHQLNAVARAIQSKRLLALHECGTGKTFTMVAACYEAQRLGIATKPVIVAHNSTLSQVVNSFKRLYPNAKLLVADESSWKERNKLIAKIQTGRYHAIILTHSQFFGIPIKPTTKIRYINKQLELIEQYMEEASQEKDRSLFLELHRQNESLREQVAEIATLEKIRTTPSNSPEFGELIQNLLKEEVIFIEENGRIEYVKPSVKTAKTNRNQKTLDKKRDTLSNSVEKATSYYSQNSINIFWEDLGCKWVWLDECHCAKNIVFATKTQGIAGITNTNTQRSLNTLLKYNWVFEEGGFIGGGTGTLPSNSITELYNIQRLFSPDILKGTGTEHFDSWLAQYGEITTSLEFTSTGGIKPRTRVSSYKNIWELISSAALFTDFATADGVGILRPALCRYTITAPMNETQLAITQTIKNWMELWQRKMPVSYAKPDGTIVEHNPLTLTSLGSLASIDPRLVEPNAPVHLDTKLTRLIHNVWHIWKASTPARGTQVIFCDSGVPNKAKGLFDCYNYIRDHLVGLGVPRREIAFVHECKTDEERFDLYGKINAGVVRVAICFAAALRYRIHGEGRHGCRLSPAHRCNAPSRFELDSSQLGSASGTRTPPG
jgi:N12 class adenine-specific DNA methylase